jgi:hypothetical protein
MDWERIPDSYWDYQKVMKDWAWRDPERSWPDIMPGATCGDWIDQAIGVLSVVNIPVPVRRAILRRLYSASHHCDKWDDVRDWDFDDSDLELVQWLAGPYPREAC